MPRGDSLIRMLFLKNAGSTIEYYSAILEFLQRTTGKGKTLEQHPQPPPLKVTVSCIRNCSLASALELAEAFTKQLHPKNPRVKLTDYT